MKWFKMKKLGLLLMATLLAVSIAGCGNSEKSSGGGDAKSVKIGFLTDITGPAAAYGEAIKNGADLAIEEINAKAAKDKGLKLDIVFEDGKTQKNDVLNAMNKMINKDKVVAIMGPMISGEMFAAGPIANRDKVVAFGTSTTAEGITDIGPWIFRNAIPESLAVPAAIKKAHNVLGFKTAAVLYSQNNDQMVSVNKIAQAELEKLGVKVLDTETFSDQDTDFSAQLTKVQQSNPDVIIVASLYQAGALIVKKMREMGMNQHVIGSNGFNSPAFIKNAGPAADGSIVASPWFPNSKEEKVQAFRKAYKEKYGKEPDQFAAQAYDGMYILYQAAQAPGAATDREKFKEALQNLKGFVGVTGKIEFDKNRNPVSDLQVLEVKDGAYVSFGK